jgi:hypothetical protein
MLVDTAFVTVFSRPTSFREMHRTAYTLLSKPFEKEGYFNLHIFTLNKAIHNLSLHRVVLYIQVASEGTLNTFTLNFVRYSLTYMHSFVLSYIPVFSCQIALPEIFLLSKESKAIYIYMLSHYWNNTDFANCLVLCETSYCSSSRTLDNRASIVNMPWVGWSRNGNWIPGRHRVVIWPGAHTATNLMGTGCTSRM